jgi:predicted SnoaL-like aldol condensation-catalyzing enzyme
MRWFAALATLSMLATTPAFSKTSETERNRRIVTDFARTFYEKRDVDAAFKAHVAVDYIQHNPGIADGRQAAIDALKPMFSKPGARFEVKRIIVDGDMAVIHLFGRGDPATRGAAVADIYRLSKGKIVEHWDILQPMPETSANPHPMF